MQEIVESCGATAQMEQWKIAIFLIAKWYLFLL